MRIMASEGQIQSELMESMRNKIQVALEAEDVQVTDMQGDGRHVEIVVVSSQFEGKSSVNRQRMVYKVRSVWCGKEYYHIAPCGRSFMLDGGCHTGLFERDVYYLPC